MWYVDLVNKFDVDFFQLSRSLYAREDLVFNNSRKVSTKIIIIIGERFGLYLGKDLNFKKRIGDIGNSMVSPPLFCNNLKGNFQMSS